jgi:hypothetical protein
MQLFQKPIWIIVIFNFFKTPYHFSVITIISYEAMIKSFGTRPGSWYKKSCDAGLSRCVFL